MKILCKKLKSLVVMAESRYYYNYGKTYTAVSLPLRRHFMPQKAWPLLSFSSVPVSELQFAVECGNYSDSTVKRAVQADGKVTLFLSLTKH
jgi:hypothetical protein